MPWFIAKGVRDRLLGEQVVSSSHAKRHRGMESRLQRRYSQKLWSTTSIFAFEKPVAITDFHDACRIQPNRVSSDCRILFTICECHSLSFSSVSALLVTHSFPSCRCTQKGIYSCRTLNDFPTPSTFPTHLIFLPNSMATTVILPVLVFDAACLRCPCEYYVAIGYP